MGRPFEVRLGIFLAIRYPKPIQIGPLSLWERVGVRVYPPNSADICCAACVMTGINPVIFSSDM